MLDVNNYFLMNRAPLENRLALVRLAIEMFVAGPGATRLAPDTRLVFIIVLEASLSGSPITASRIALIGSLQRTTVRRKLQALKAAGIVTYGPAGWRVTEKHIARPEVDGWVSRLEGLVGRTNDIIQKSLS
jgi:hypothetical protein